MYIKFFNSVFLFSKTREIFYNNYSWHVTSKHLDMQTDKQNTITVNIVLPTLLVSTPKYSSSWLADVNPRKWSSSSGLVTPGTRMTFGWGGLIQRFRMSLIVTDPLLFFRMLAICWAAAEGKPLVLWGDIGDSEEELGGRAPKFWTVFGSSMSTSFSSIKNDV